MSFLVLFLFFMVPVLCIALAVLYWRLWKRVKTLETAETARQLAARLNVDGSSVVSDILKNVPRSAASVVDVPASAVSDAGGAS